MRKNLIQVIVVLVIGAVYAFTQIAPQGNQEPWTEKQLMNPADLAKIISDSSSKKPYIFSVGPGGGIPFSVETGEAKEKKNLDNLKKEISKLYKNADIVLYCGCCPFDKCPNIRPAFKMLNEMKFMNHKLLNLSTNLKIDWIDKSYPVN